MLSHRRVLTSILKIIKSNNDDRDKEIYNSLLANTKQCGVVIYIGLLTPISHRKKIKIVCCDHWWTTEQLYAEAIIKIITAVALYRGTIICIYPLFGIFVSINDTALGASGVEVAVKELYKNG